MADLIRVEGVPPYDGDYELDLARFFNGDELHFIKQKSGVRAGELEEAFQAGDYDVILACAVIAMRRAGRDDVEPAALWSAEVGKIQYVAGEVDAGPPDSTPPTEEESRRSGGENTSSSGSGSRSDGDPPANGQSPTGSPLSARSVMSGSETSV